MRRLAKAAYVAVVRAAPPTDLNSRRNAKGGRVAGQGGASNVSLPFMGRERSLAGLFDLAVFELDGGGAAEDGDGDAQAGAFLVDLFH